MHDFDVIHMTAYSTRYITYTLKVEYLGNRAYGLPRRIQVDITESLRLAVL